MALAGSAAHCCLAAGIQFFEEKCYIPNHRMNIMCRTLNVANSRFPSVISGGQGHEQPSAGGHHSSHTAALARAAIGAWRQPDHRHAGMGSA